MKAKKLLLAALVIFISATSFAQITLVPATQTVTEPRADSSSILAVDSASVDSASTDSLAANASSPQTGDAAGQPMIIFGWDDEKTNYLIGFLALIIFLLITNFKESISAFIKSGALKVKIRPRVERLKTTLQEEQIITQIHEERVKRKANTMTKLGNAVSKVLGDIFKEKPKWSEWTSVLRFVIPFFGWLLEGLLFFRWWNFRRALWLLAFATVIFGIWTLKPIQAQGPEETVVEPPQPIDTPEVVIVDVPEIEEPDPVQRPDNPRPVVRQPGPDEWYVDAPVDRYGQEVILYTGYEYTFKPEDNVFGLPEPNNPNSTSVPFPDGPGVKNPKRFFERVAWTSRVGFDTRVKVSRVWKGTTNV